MQTKHESGPQASDNCQILYKINSSESQQVSRSIISL